MPHLFFKDSTEIFFGLSNDMYIICFAFWRENVESGLNIWLRTCLYLGESPCHGFYASRFEINIAPIYAFKGGIPNALVFTAGIGERSPLKRKLIVKALEPFGFSLDQEKNEKNDVLISEKENSRKVLVIPTNEELVIANETIELIKWNKLNRNEIHSLLHFVFFSY